MREPKTGLTLSTKILSECCLREAGRQKFDFSTIIVFPANRILSMLIYVNTLQSNCVHRKGLQVVCFRCQ